MIALILAGGKGTRFWPASRRSWPKQFLTIRGDRSLLQLTIDRLDGLVRPEDIYVACGPEYEAEVRSQLEYLDLGQVIVEPAARNTAAGIGWAAARLHAVHPGGIMAVLPADHVIRDIQRFHRALKAAEVWASRGYLVTFGIRPASPATGYGYIEMGEALEAEAQGEFPACRVARFHEKPALEEATRMLKSGKFLWNSGMFVWSLETILEEIRVHLPELDQALRELTEGNLAWNQMVERFAELQSVSIDYGVMEKSERVVVIPCDLGWSDVGSWSALAEVQGLDEAGNATEGDVVLIDTRNSVVQGFSGQTVALLGVDGLVVVATSDAILVCPREQSEQVRKVVRKLEEEGRDTLL